eukprot:CAMPEP_0168330390 /NCGR_PEP_ID=MMETSP0213-20121227/7701_1 /TAXON_ID=151035 /ORGANISM="Euplotes harpa, Strain FSP1.4" /LENGTH=168 /DNA_ID=CAMNT_0008333949 /DNA_START=205 /DNA_END=708 /DNA_ORIENTATION=+
MAVKAIKSSQKREITLKSNKSWDETMKNRYEALYKRSIEIKDFSKFKTSDIENITVLNTVLNAYISRLYQGFTSTLAAVTNGSADLLSEAHQENSSAEPAGRRLTSLEEKEPSVSSMGSAFGSPHKAADTQSDCTAHKERSRIFLIERREQSLNFGRAKTLEIVTDKP